MPTQTFHNLEKIKQKAIIDACIDEFSTCPFSQASINQIIKKANISRGSFYQYFEDKQDCYLTILHHIAQTKLAIFESVANQQKDSDVFDTLLKMFEATIAWIKTEPKLYKVGYWMDYDDSEFIKKLLANNQQSITFFEDLIKKDQLNKKIKAEIDPTLLTKIFFVINKEVLIEGFKQANYELIHSQFKQICAILKGGVAHV